MHVTSANGCWPTTAACWSTPWAASRASFPPATPVPTPPTSRTTGCCWNDWAISALERRTARFVCHIAVADPTGEIQAESEAACRGRILFAPRGEAGFGYDPLFEIVEYHRSFAELGLRAKAHLSHRARAACRLIPQLIQLADSGKI